MIHLQIAQVVTFIAAFALAATRILTASKPFWSFAPPWLASLLPGLIVAIPALGQAVVGAQSLTDLTVAFLVAGALLLPGSHSHTVAVTKPNGPSSTALAFLLAAGLALSPLGCASLAAVSPYLAQAAVIISDAVNAINAAEALLPSIHLGADEQAKAEQLIARLRAAASAAAKADAGLTDLTAEQLDASLADFRAAWGELEQVFAVKRIGAVQGSAALPKPLALKRVSQ